jgi:hypothetical protein
MLKEENVKLVLDYFVLNTRDTEHAVGLPGLALDLTRVRREIRKFLPSCLAVARSWEGEHVF